MQRPGRGKGQRSLPRRPSRRCQQTVIIRARSRARPRRRSSSLFRPVRRHRARGRAFLRASDDYLAPPAGLLVRHRPGRGQHDRLGHLPAAGHAGALRRRHPGRLGHHPVRRAAAGGHLRPAGAALAADRRPLRVRAQRLRRTARLRGGVELLDLDVVRHRRDRGRLRRQRRRHLPRADRHAGARGQLRPGRAVAVCRRQPGRAARGRPPAAADHRAEGGAAAAVRAGGAVVRRHRPLRAVQPQRGIAGQRGRRHRGADAVGDDRPGSGHRAGRIGGRRAAHRGPRHRGRHRPGRRRPPYWPAPPCSACCRPTCWPVPARRWPTPPPRCGARRPACCWRW